MKKKILLLLGIFSIGLMHAQVGIKTKNPAALLHIDGKGNTSGSSNITDDVIIDTNGNIGLGILAPTAKVHSVGSSTLSPMRITDTKQAKDQILVSDANGNASWMPKPFPGGVIYSAVGSKITYTLNSTILVRAIPISVTGNYLISIRWWGVPLSVAGNNLSCGVFFVATSANTANNWTADSPAVRDQVEYCTNTRANAYTCFSSTLFSKAVKGQYLKLYIRVTSGGNWVIGSVDINNKLWNPSIVVFRV